MAKRFIEPNWKVLRTLPDNLQRAWFYIWDKADACGVYHYDGDYMKLDLSLNEAIKFEMLASLPDCKILDAGRILIKNFLVVNYGHLKEGYNPHKPAFRDLAKNHLTLNSSLNEACFKLEEEGEDEEEDKDEKKGGVGENKFQPVGIVPDLIADFKLTNPKYPVDQKTDFAAAREIAEKIVEWDGLAGLDDREKIRRRWGEIVTHVNQDGHFRKYSLSQINKHFQSIAQSLNGTHKQHNPNGSKGLGTSEARIEKAAKWGS